MLEIPPFLTLDDVDFQGKSVLVRVDINSPIDPQTGEILDASRIEAHSTTIKTLENSKVVILAHQGRPGSSDFTTLEEHSRVLSKYLEKEVEYIDDIIGPAARDRISRLKPGEVLMLENVRFLAEETLEFPPEKHANSWLVRKLSPLFDLFVNDAFAAAHRPHASLTGFPEVLPAVAGRVMEKELRALSRVFADWSRKKRVFVIGGAKIGDMVKFIDTLLTQKIANQVLLGGLVSLLFLKASGFSLGEPTESVLESRGASKYIDLAKDLLQRYSSKIALPTDVAENQGGERKEINVSNLPAQNPIMDVGGETIDRYKAEIASADIVVLKGPAGVIEEPAFSLGTKEILRAVAHSKALSIVGGGHESAILNELGLTDKIDYVSSGGGALIAFLSGETLPAVEALARAAARMRGA